MKTPLQQGRHASGGDGVCQDPRQYCLCGVRRPPPPVYPPTLDDQIRSSPVYSAVPAGIDPPRRLESLSEAALASQAPDSMVYPPDGRPMRLQDFLGVSPAAQLEPVGRFGITCDQADRWW